MQDHPARSEKHNDNLRGEADASQHLTRLTRHPRYPREHDGAIGWRKLLPMFYPDYPEVKRWRLQTWLNHLEKGNNKKILQYCRESYGYILYMRAIQGRSAVNKLDLSLQDNVEIPYNWIDYIYHVGSSHDCNSLIQSGLIAV